MTIEIQIERDSGGRLHGFVLEHRRDGFTAKGEDLLQARVFRQVDSAVMECDRQILALFQLVEPPKINYVLPGDWHK
jgi:hypothetical protein